MKEDEQRPVLLSGGIMRLDCQDAMETRIVNVQSQQTPWRDVSRWTPQPSQVTSEPLASFPWQSSSPREHQPKGQPADQHDEGLLPDDDSAPTTK